MRRKLTKNMIPKTLIIEQHIAQPALHQTQVQAIFDSPPLYIYHTKIIILSNNENLFCFFNFFGLIFNK